MGKSFKSDRRFERRRHREQYDVVVKGKHSREFNASSNLEEFHAQQREAQFNRLVARQRQALSEERLRQQSELHAARFQTGVERLREGLQQVSVIVDEVFIDQWRANLQSFAQRVRSRVLTEGAANEIVSRAWERQVNFSSIESVDDLVATDGPIHCLVYPANILGAVGPEQAEQLSALYKAAEMGGIVFVDRDHDIVLSFGDYYGNGYVNLPTFLALCAKRTSSSFVVSRSMAAATTQAIKRKTRLDD
ncbi:hypothetical protein CC53_gp005 [Rhizobium phage vB_RleS_L338C]|uniref:hypothetical protein n=1 Tax=Rhizobium phage vB_RleS_L338C TaxID=1414737 RepID=UPI0003D82CCE|nr:hypothetical protein CC53_gp005 [Rhizobium phage vB_RleS_L338C]AHC30422.1 hypothetical protein L338C_005 [Rhizobium phage vB_RleS_L338C]QNH72064.1 hypothetical protein P11VFA_132 [Rhizobium phage P11VFA]